LPQLLTNLLSLKISRKVRMTFNHHHCVFLFTSFVTLGEISAFDGWTAYCEEQEFEKPPDASALSLAVWTQCKGIPRPTGFIDWIPSKTNAQVCIDAGGQVLEHTCESVEKIMKDVDPLDVQALSATSFKDRCCVESVSDLWSWMKSGCGSAELDADRFDAGKQAWTECAGISDVPNEFSKSDISEENSKLCTSAGGVATVYTCDDVEQMIRQNEAYAGWSREFQLACCPWTAMQEAESPGNDAEGWYRPTSTKAPNVLGEVAKNSTKANVAGNGMHVVPSPPAVVALFALTLSSIGLI